MRDYIIILGSPAVLLMDSLSNSAFTSAQKDQVPASEFKPPTTRLGYLMNDNYPCIDSSRIVITTLYCIVSSQSAPAAISWISRHCELHQEPNTSIARFKSYHWVRIALLPTFVYGEVCSHGFVPHIERSIPRRTTVRSTLQASLLLIRR